MGAVAKMAMTVVGGGGDYAGCDPEIVASLRGAGDNDARGKRLKGVHALLRQKDKTPSKPHAKPDSCNGNGKGPREEQGTRASGVPETWCGASASSKRKDSPNSCWRRTWPVRRQGESNAKRNSSNGHWRQTWCGARASSKRAKPVAALTLPGVVTEKPPCRALPGGRVAPVDTKEASN